MPDPGQGLRSKDSARSSYDLSRAAAYSETALRRVWRAQDFSNYMTTLLHRFDTGAFDEKVQLGRLEYVRRSEAAAKSLAENYAGLPFGW